MSKNIPIFKRNIKASINKIVDKAVAELGELPVIKATIAFHTDIISKLLRPDPSSGNCKLKLPYINYITTRLLDRSFLLRLLEDLSVCAKCVQTEIYDFIEVCEFLTALKQKALLIHDKIREHT